MPLAYDEHTSTFWDMDTGEERGLLWDDIPASVRHPLGHAMAAAVMQSASLWEHFADKSYYDLWCVRRTGDRSFGSGFHVTSEAEAMQLAALLNKVAAEPPR